MIARFRPSVARGSVDAPPSKTLAHRFLLAAALSESPSVVRGLCLSEDVLATIDCARSLGADVRLDGTDAHVDPQALPPSDLFPCRESGSTLRFFLPAALRRPTGSLFTGSPRLLERPLGVYEDLCRDKGLKFGREDGGIRVRGPLEPGNFRINGSVSSQFITGLLFALPLLPGPSVLELVPPVVSLPYVKISVSVLRRSGIRIEEDGPNGFRIPGNQVFRAKDVRVEGDWSNAAFPDALNLIGGRVKVGNLDPESEEGDRAYRQIYPLLSEGSPTVDIRDIPDLAPVIMALGSALHGVTLTGTARLKLKESDRGSAMAEEIAKFGARCEIGEDEIRVFPSPGGLKKPDQPVYAHNDHRIAMAASLLLSLTGGELMGAECVRKSWPEFYEALSKLGIEVSLHDDPQR